MDVELLTMDFKLVLFLLFLSGSSFACEDMQSQNVQKPSKPSNESRQVPLEPSCNNFRHDVVLLESKFATLKLRYEELLISNIEQKKLLSDLQGKINQKQPVIDSTHSDWAGIMLGAASLIITVFSISIAVLAAWGFRNIKRTAVREATKKSEAAAIKKSESSVEKAINEHKFDQTIYYAVEKVVYRGILSEDDFPPESEEGN